MRFLLVFLLVIPSVSYAEVYRLYWTHPIIKEDESELLRKEIKEYRVYYTDTYGGELFKTFSAWGDVKGRGYMAWWEPTKRTYCIVMTTIDLKGRESLYSNKVCYYPKPSNPILQCR